MSIAANLKRIRDEIGPNVKCVVVIKGKSIQEMMAVQKAGAQIIAENRVQEAERKWGSSHPSNPTSASTERHLIGHLQTNKVKQAVRLFDVIQSVDSVRLAERLNEEGIRCGKTIRIMVQVNIGKESQKYGFLEEELKEALQKLNQMGHLNVEGLMTIVPYRENTEETRPYFHAMAELYKKISNNHGLNNNLELSMGMSHDYRIAIEEGATMVRIGSAIFSTP